MSITLCSDAADDEAWMTLEDVRSVST